MISTGMDKFRISPGGGPVRFKIVHTFVHRNNTFQPFFFIEFIRLLFWGVLIIQDNPPQFWGPYTT